MAQRRGRSRGCPPPLLDKAEQPGELVRLVVERLRTPDPWRLLSL